VRLALDTNKYRDLAAGEDLDLADTIHTALEVHLPFVVVAELKAGFGLGKRAAENEALLQRFLAQPGIEILFPDPATLDTYAMLMRQLRKQGTPIPTNDIWIAALVLRHGLTLATRDRHFENLPQIPLLSRAR
jgi:tRNA(fMet)-specific endonuclease VapC